MPTLDDIKAQIKTICQGLTGIGIIYDHFIYGKTQDEMKNLFTVNDSVNVLMFRPATRIGDTMDRGNNELLIQRKWNFLLITAYNIDNESEKNFDNFSELMCKTFNANLTLNGTVKQKSPLNMTGKLEKPYHGVTCHWGIFEFTTKD